MKYRCPVCTHEFEGADPKVCPNCKVAYTTASGLKAVPDLASFHPPAVNTCSCGHHITAHQNNEGRCASRGCGCQKFMPGGAPAVGAKTPAEDDELRLLPCPFCGGTATFRENEGGHYVECGKCRAGTCMMFPEKCDVLPLLAERWNSRPAPISPAAGNFMPGGEAERLKRLQEERESVYGDTETNMRTLGIAWTALIEAHYRIKLSEPIPPHVAALILVTLKTVRMCGPAFHHDNYDDAANFLRFAAEVDPRRPK